MSDIIKKQLEKVEKQEQKYLNQKENAFRKNSLYYTEKNSSFVDVFSEKIFDLVLKFTRLSFATLFMI